MKLHDKFIGGNIRILRQENDVYFLDSDPTPKGTGSTGRSV